MESGTSTYEEDLAIDIDGPLVLLSVLVASVGALATLTTASYLCRVQSRKWYCVMLVQCGLGLGVGTIWTLHFIGMRAANFKTLRGDTISLGYDAGLTLLSAVCAWIFTILAIHVLEMEKRSAVRADLSQKTLLGVSLLAVGFASMHYVGVISERGFFRLSCDTGMLLAHVPVLVLCSYPIALIFMHPPTKIISKGLACVSVAGLTAIAHYFGITVMSHRSHPEGWTWRTLPGKFITVSAETTVIISLFCDVLLMAMNLFYLEVIQVQERSEMSKELEYRTFVADALPLMKRCQSMQFPLTLVSATVFLQQGRLVKYETLRDAHLLVMVDTPKAAGNISRNGCIIFFSHQWLCRDLPDPTGCQFKDMAFAIEEIAGQQDLDMDHVLIWVDYCSIPQSSPEQQQLAINSLPAYVAACDAFVIITTSETHQDTAELCDFQSYSTRFWCRLEVLCATMTTMNQISEDHPQRVYNVSDRVMCSLTFSNEFGVIPEYLDLFHVYDGRTNCCACDHRLPDGRHIACDKDRVATTLVGVYGTMLVQAMRLRKLKPLSVEGQNFLELCELLIEDRQTLFPPEYFGTRIEAVHHYLDEVSRSSGENLDSRGQDLRKTGQSMSRSLSASSSGASQSLTFNLDVPSPTFTTESEDETASVEMATVEDLAAELSHRQTSLPRPQRIGRDGGENDSTRFKLKV